MAKADDKPTTVKLRSLVNMTKGRSKYAPGDEYEAEAAEAERDVRFKRAERIEDAK